MHFHRHRLAIPGEALILSFPNAQSIEVGVVIRKSPGVTRWAKWAWQAVAVLPGAAQASWKVLRSENEVTDYHAATLKVDLFVSDTEAYAHEMQTRTPSLYVILRETTEPSEAPFDVVVITASPYEAQDYADSGEEIVEKVAMPPSVLEWIREFVALHHEEEPFVKRRRNNNRVDQIENGIGDPRVVQPSDVYRAPVRQTKRVLS
ncbi:MAG: DUF3305 domain-containing protein [Rhodobacter sp.]|jgi:hypothetical protein|nr:DUF3305 domain-containing protein [Rhodobacter sp.]